MNRLGMLCNGFLGQDPFVLRHREQGLEQESDMFKVGESPRAIPQLSKFQTTVPG